MRKDLSNLIIDRLNNDKIVKFSTEEAVKVADKSILGNLRKLFDLKENERLTYNKLKQHEWELFTIISEVLSVRVPLGIQRNAFLDDMAEFRNLAAGELTEFVFPDTGVLCVSRFSGNHWNVDRQRFKGKRKVNITPAWFYVAVYEDLERVLANVITIEEMFEKIQQAIERDVYARIFTAWNYAGGYLPDQFTESGSFDRDAMLGLVERVQIATGKDVQIVGTRQGLSQMFSTVGGDPNGWMSNNMKDEMNQLGKITMWNGIATYAIPQAFIPGTWDFAINPNMLRVITGDFKPIKIVHEGDYRIRNQEYHETESQEYFFQTQFRMGVGVLFSDMYGEYMIS